LGVYAQDQIDLLDNLILVLGGRFDIVSERSEDFINETTEFQQDQAFSPRLGIVYRPASPLSLYASYSRSFQQVTGRAFDQSLFEPQRGTQYEIGAKADLTSRLSATLALFDLTRSNVLTEDPDNPNFDIQTGEQRSRGVEFFVSGEVLPGWNITGGYAYTDARITRDNTFEVGNRLNNAPEHSLSLWSTYQITTGDLSGLGVGLGLFYTGERQGDLANTFSLPSYLRTDASIFYERDRFRAAVGEEKAVDSGGGNAAGGLNPRRTLTAPVQRAAQHLGGVCPVYLAGGGPVSGQYCRVGLGRPLDGSGPDGGGASHQCLDFHREQ
jgi:iron complex outermembrane receptor protein